MVGSLFGAAELHLAGPCGAAKPVGPRPDKAACAGNRGARLSVSIVFFGHLSAGSVVYCALAFTVASTGWPLGILLFVFTLAGLFSRLYRVVMDNSY